MEVEAIRETLNEYPKSMKKFEAWYIATHPGPFEDFLKLPEWAIIGVAKQFIQEVDEALSQELWAGQKEHPSNDIFKFVVKAFQKMNTESSQKPTSETSKKKKQKR